MTHPLVETWNINARIHAYILDTLPPEALASIPQGKGRSVAEAFAHVHNVRLMWLKVAAPDLLAGLSKLEKGAVDKKALLKVLSTSQAAIAALITKSVADGGKVKGFKPHVEAFVGYLISHESHHRGQIALALKEAGHALDKKTSYGIWEWGVR
ncbi:MAG: DinB family protein [Thermoanaerobaculia bacterium]